MSTICLHIGRLEEARIAHERAHRTNPETRTGNLEWFYLMSGDYAQAEQAAEAWFLDRPGNLYALDGPPAPALIEWRSRCRGERLAVA